MAERHISELQTHFTERLQRQVRHASSAMFQVYTNTLYSEEISLQALLAAT